jgi:hypothetical protein
VINSSRSERGWRGRRRIAVLVSLAGVLGLCALGSAGTASAATVANCNAKLEPKGASTSAKLSFVCDGPVRAYGVGSNKPIKDYSAPHGGAASSFVICQGTGAGFGCGITNRAAPGTEAPGTTGWNTTTPGASTSATATPTTCNGFTRTQGAGTPNNGPNLNSIVTGPCTQQIEPGTKVVQSLKLGSSPCAGGKKNPFEIFLFVGGEPAVTSFIDPVSGNSNPAMNGPGGDSSTVGEYIQGPIKVNMKAYKKACAKSGNSGKAGTKGGGMKSSSPPTMFPVSCSGSVAPSTAPAGAEATLTFTCNQNIRAFGVYTNKLISEPGDEPIVTGEAGGGVNESANAQCEGAVPGAGYGCGTVDRQTVTGAKTTPPTNPGLPNGNTITAGNTASQNIAFLSSPCRRPGEAKAKIWLVPMGEPTIGSTVGEFVGAPQQLALTGYGRCKGKKKR